MAGSAQVKDRLQANPDGINEVHCSENPSVDIVFVHGLNGSPYSTWATKDTDFFWPAQLLPRTLRNVPSRVLMFGYDSQVAVFMGGASEDRLHNHAESLAAKLYANRSLNNALERPIIFVAHSLGGLVVKKALLYCSQVRNKNTRHLRSIFVSTYGILFMGTPHNGSDMAKLGKMVQSIVHVMAPKKLFGSTDHLLNVLKPDNENLQNITRDFAHIMKDFHIYFFNESLPMDLKGTHSLIVDASSAAPVIDGTERMSINADHGSMCRFRDENSAGYEAVAEAIIRYSKDARKIIPSRWEQDRLLKEAQSRTEIERIEREMGIPPRKSNGSLPPLPSTDGQENTPGVESNNPQGANEQLFVLPPGFHPNSTFVGMRSEINQLYSRLFNAEKRNRGSVAVLLHGGPGSGKSHLARQYMYEYQGKYPGGVFWVDSTTSQSRANGYWHIARAACELGDEHQAPDPTWFSNDTYAEKVRQWLESREDWLLIFDGITVDEDSDLDWFKSYLPFNKNTSILYTSVDRTLTKKARLFEPSALQVKPLAVPEARKLLFKGLGVKHPTAGQETKATALVEHYECLPLAIRAISHRLVANGKPLENYVAEGHLTDQSLASPFQGILNDLIENNSLEALHLIHILSFFENHVPVGMILFGRKALAQFEVEIRSLDRIGSTERHIDNTIATLIKYGLLERPRSSYLQSDQSSSGSSFGQGSSQGSRNSPDSEDPPVRNLGAINTPHDSMDIIKTHTVIQQVCRDEMWTQNKAGYYWWMGVVISLFHHSYTEGTARIKATRGPGHVRDYREYQTHARRIFALLPKRLKMERIDLRPCRNTLLEISEDIEKEIENRSPSSSQESVRNQKSIFDNASSMSTEPNTPTSGSSRRSFVGAEVVTSSPDEHLPPHGPRFDFNQPAVRIADRDDGSKSRDTSVGPSRPPSEATEVPPSPASRTQDGEVRKPETPNQSVKKLRAFWQVWHDFRRSRDRELGRGHKDLGDRRPVPPVLTREQGEGSSIPLKDPVQDAPLHSRSQATSLLTRIGHSSPPPTRGRSVRPTSQPRIPAGSRPPYPAAQMENQERLPFHNGPTANSTQLQVPDLDIWPLPGDQGRTFTDMPPIESHTERMSQSTYSDPGTVLPYPSQSGVGSSTPYSSAHLRQQRLSNSSEPPEGYRQRRSPEANLLPLPYDENVPISRRQPNTRKEYSGTMRDASLRKHLSSTALPTAYRSLPMSRDVSQQSTQSLHTEPPPQFPSNFSPEPSYNFAAHHQLAYSSPNVRPHGSPHSTPPQKFAQMAPGTDSDFGTPSSTGAQPMSRGSSGPGMVAGDGSVMEFSNRNVRFSEKDAINGDDARWQAEMYEQWLRSQPDGGGSSAIPRYTGLPPYPKQNLMPTSSDKGELESLLARTAIDDMPRRSMARRHRARSGSSPAGMAVRGLGVRYQ